MSLEFTAYALPLFVGALLLTGILRLVWRHRNTAAGGYALWIYGAMIIYALGYAFELSSTSAKGAAFWLKVEYLGVPFLAPFLSFLIIAVVGHEHRLTPRNIALLMVIPTITFVLAWTNDSHELIWRNISIDRSHGYTGTQFDAGAWYIVTTIYAHIIFAAIFILIIYGYRRTTGLHRNQLAIGFFSMLPPILADVAYQFRLGPPGLDMTPYGFILTGVGTGIGLLYFQLFDVTPIAHREIVASLHDAVIIVDTAHRVVDVNPSAITVIGVPKTILIGQPVTTVFPPALDPITGFIITNTEYAEIELSIPDLHYYDVRNQTVRQRNGRTVGHVIVMRDITARRNAEIERTQLIEELDAFAHTVAHDLKNPLTVITGFCEVILDAHADDNIPPDITESVKLIQVNGFKISSIIEELLLLSGVRQVSTVMRQPIDTAQLISDAWARLFTLVKERNAQLTLPPEWPTAVGYGPWIEEVWTNYLSNAIKYGGTPPLITTGADALPDGSIRFWVRDNGPGIAPEEQKRLFVPFTRLHQMRAQGHGLGLSIAHRIIKKHGGIVGVESTPGAGSMFFFTLPAHNGSSSTEADSSPETEPADPTK